MTDHAPEGSVLVFRNSVGDPIAVPEDVVTAAERAYRCHLLRVAGHSWEEIAQAEHFPTAGMAKYDVERYLAEGKALIVEQSQREALTLEVARLDALQLGLWDKAVHGHVPATMAVVNIIKTRAQLVGLDAREMHDQATGPRTLVVPLDKDQYLAVLKEAAGIPNQQKGESDVSK